MGLWDHEVSNFQAPTERDVQVSLKSASTASGQTSAAWVLKTGHGKALLGRPLGGLLSRFPARTDGNSFPGSLDPRLGREHGSGLSSTRP